MATPPDSPIAAEKPSMERVDVVRTLKDAGFAALIAFFLFLPLIGFKTIQNIRNEIALETRFALLFWCVLIVAAARLLHSLALAPWLARRAARLPASSQDGAAITTTIGTWA